MSAKRSRDRKDVRAVTVGVAARMLKVNPRTVFRWIKEKKLDAIHYGPPHHGLTLVTLDSIEAAPKPENRGPRATSGPSSLRERPPRQPRRKRTPRKMRRKRTA